MALILSFDFFHVEILFLSYQTSLRKLNFVFLTTKICLLRLVEIQYYFFEDPFQTVKCTGKVSFIVIETKNEIGSLLNGLLIHCLLPEAKKIISTFLEICKHSGINE
jgi:hypothetical protein